MSNFVFICGALSIRVTRTIYKRKIPVQYSFKDFRGQGHFQTEHIKLGQSGLMSL